MKIGGFILVLLGLWWAYMWRHDPAEGPVMRAVGYVGMLAGLFLFFEGLKREIITAVRKGNGDLPRQTVGSGKE